MKWIFHGSSAADLKIIEPKVSEHGQAYVYGVLNRNDALWYCSDFKDFYLLADENMQIDKNKVRKLYLGKTGYIYMLEKVDFTYDYDIGHWVSTKPVEVVHCEKVEDIFTAMCSISGFFNLSLEQIKVKRID